MFQRTILAVLLVMSGNIADADAQPARGPARGELLYSTHCIACHSDKVHWRDKKVARDFRSLRAEVRRWQRLSALGWSNDDVEAVARYLNTLHYHYPVPY